MSQTTMLNSTIGRRGRDRRGRDVLVGGVTGKYLYIKYLNCLLTQKCGRLLVRWQQKNFELEMII